MRILIINSVCGICSTGRICTDIADDLISQGHTVRIAYGREDVPDKYKSISVRIGSNISVYAAAFLARVFDNEGFNCKKTTKQFLKWAEEYDPDILWLHNLHGYYLNVELLFEWIKTRPQMQVKWTLHDCWAFTGHCSHFAYVGCENWKIGCKNCLQTNEYPQSVCCDNSSQNFIRKRNAFSNVPNMKLIVPSQWLANLVSKSFLSKYPIEVVYNIVDRKQFKPSPSDFREKHDLVDKKIVLGVASAWGERKGLLDFVKLAEMLDDSYQIVLVGLTKKQMRNISKKILCISKTNNLKELSEIYTAADVFVNPSKEEVFGLTTIEALACGTPAVVYKNTACEEIALMCGGVVVEQSVFALKNVIEKICKDGNCY